MRPKPSHLGPEYAAQFGDASVSDTYGTRPPYPEALFDFLPTLARPADGAFLDLGCGTGDIAIGLAKPRRTIDAIDPSAAMIAAAQRRPTPAGCTLRFIETRAEDFKPAHRYGLAIAAESFHWMDWPQASARVAAALLPKAPLVFVYGREFHALPWATELREIIPRYTTNREFKPYDLIEEVTSRGLFTLDGERTIVGPTISQPLADYVESFHTRNGFSRDRMTEASAAAFDRVVTELVRSYRNDERVEGHIELRVTWGRPHTARRHGPTLGS